MILRMLRATTGPQRTAIVVCVVSILALGMSAYSSYKGRQAEQRRAEYVACQANYNEINNQRTRALTDVVDQERRAQRAVNDAAGALWTAVLANPGTPRTPADQANVLALATAYRDALAAQKTAAAEADKARAANPVPDPPSIACG